MAGVDDCWGIYMEVWWFNDGGAAHYKKAFGDGVVPCPMGSHPHVVSDLPSDITGTVAKSPFVFVAESHHVSTYPCQICLKLQSYVHSRAFKQCTKEGHIVDR